MVKLQIEIRPQVPRDAQARLELPYSFQSRLDDPAPVSRPSFEKNHAKDYRR